MSLTLEQLKAHANPSNWEVRAQYIDTEVVSEEPEIIIETQMVIAHNRVLRKTVDIAMSEFNAFFINTNTINDSIRVLYNTDGTVLSIRIAGVDVTPGV